MLILTAGRPKQPLCFVVTSCAYPGHVPTAGYLKATQHLQQPLCFIGITCPSPQCVSPAGYLYLQPGPAVLQAVAAKVQSFDLIQVRGRTGCSFAAEQDGRGCCAGLICTRVQQQQGGAVPAAGRFDAEHDTVHNSAVPPWPSTHLLSSSATGSLVKCPFNVQTTKRSAHPRPRPVLLPAYILVGGHAGAEA